MTETLQVEVCIQDYVWDAATPEQTPPITEEQWQRWFQQWLTLLSPVLSPLNEYELTLRLTTDEEMKSLNAHYRQKDQPTDVLAFAALEVDCLQIDLEEMPLYLGDLVISINTAERQAIDRGHSLMQELAWLAAHGLLHLLGWDHPDDSSLDAMLAEQERLLEAVGVKL